MRHSALLNAIASAGGDPTPPSEQDSEQFRLWDTIYEREPTAEDRRGLRVTVRLLQEIARRARALGAEPVVLMLPESCSAPTGGAPRESSATPWQRRACW
jgi:hypothetical protein